MMLQASGLSAQSQQIIRCGTTEHMNYLKQQRPKLKQELEKAEQTIQWWINNHSNFRIASTAADTIPVVVHVVYKTAIENISTAQIMSQIDVLNEDFSRTNADSVNTPSVWQPIAGKMAYHFILARRDPFGNPTNGITRQLTNVNSFTTNDAVKFNAQGGTDSWDVNTYLNIWVCNLGGGLLGYGEFPTGVSSNTYGFVCQYLAFGRVGTLNPPYNLGRTTTHEISHCFDLYHIWGDDGGACTGSDLVSDTPNQADATSGCYTFPHTDACSTTSPGIMFMNYMDYSDDNCLNMFTQGQTTRMVAAVTNFYSTIVNSIGIQPVILQVNDASASSIITPTSNLCSTTITPVVSIKNWGLSALTSVNINYRVDNGAVNTYVWTGNLNSLSTLNVTLPSVTTTSGSHTFNAYTSLPNGVTDLNTANDSTSNSFNIINIGASIPISQSFSTATFPPAGYSINNPDGGTTWVRYATGAHSAPAGMRIDNFNYNANGEIDELILPYLNLSTGNSPFLSFWVAYSYYTVPLQYSDTLEVVVSTDCGGTWHSVYKKWSDSLSTTPPTANAFVPTPNQWRQEMIDLSAYSSSNNLIVKIRNITDFENNLYVDDINVDFNTGIDKTQPQVNFDLYPNPATDLLYVNTGLLKGERATVSIYDINGKCLLRNEVKLPEYELEINSSKFKRGIYAVTIENSYSKNTKQFEVIK